MNAFSAGNSKADIELNIGAVRARITAACARVGRDPNGVELLPVSKTVDDTRIRFAHAAGCSAFGENKVREMQGKAERLAALKARWSLIGRLQTNKVKYAARFVDEFQALGSLKLAEALQRRLEIEDRTIDVYVQVNSSGEASKYGLDPTDIPPFVRELPAFDRLRIKGLMTLAVFSADETRVRGCFRLMSVLQNMLRNHAPHGMNFDGLSMGMSSDFEIAVEEGATLVRVGQAIFGPRPLPDSHYWPDDSPASSR
ncbi:MAG TPA: YggS family pyridoxal phosphate-dependent enzyme [Parvularculaceae bacterium]|nr:YggS family pyridoxal phosphate-dependent enzyme [Parvularculaceae bacterium]